MERLLIDIAELRDEFGASTHVERDLQLEAFETRAGFVEFEGAAHVVLTLTNTGAGIVGAGTVEARLPAECSRCLELFALSVTGHIEAFYTTPDRARELPEEQDWEPTCDDAVDILPAIREALLVEIPLAPVCAEDCAGICPTCGNNRNLAPCSCHEETTDRGPFAALREMLEEPPTD